MTTEGSERNATPNPNDDKRDDADTTYRLMESVMRISIAGFGGALVGMSLSRRPQLQSSASSRRRRPYRADPNLPMTWAMACSAFCTLIEISRWTSPTSLITPSPAIQTVGDYTLGGAVAGAAFRGMQVAQRSTAVRPSILSGLVPGMVLGFLAGVTQYAANVGEEMLEQERQRRLELLVNEAEDADQAAATQLLSDKEASKER